MRDPDGRLTLFTMPLPRTLLTSSHAELDLELVAGTWPEGLTGDLWCSAPAPTPGLTYALFGFGEIIRLSLRPGTHGAAPDRWAWRSSPIDSPTRRLHDHVPEAFTVTPTGFSTPYGAPNMVNTAVLPWGDRVLATWDVGRPAELDPHTLGFVGELGHRREWGEATMPQGSGLLPFYFSSAHPVVDVDRGCLWTVKLGLDFSAGFGFTVHLVRLDVDGRVHTWPLEGAQISGSMHTIAQSAEWLVLADSGNFKADPNEIFGGERTVTIDDEIPCYLVRKAAVDATPAGSPLPAVRVPISPSTGHYYAVWDDRDGIRIIFEHMDRVDLGCKLQPDDLDAFGRPVDPAHIGFYNMAMGPSSISEVRIDPERGTVERLALLREDWSWNHQLSAMDWSAEGMADPTRHHIVFQGFRPEMVTQRALTLYGDRVERSTWPAEETAGCLVSMRRGDLAVTSRYELPNLDDLPSSPIFVPRDPGTGGRSRHAGAEPGGHDGWIVLPVLADAGLRIEVFDAGDVGHGPVATLAAPGGHTIPVLLHAAWAPAIDAGVSPEASLHFGDEVDDEVLAGLDDRLVAAAHAVADELSDR